MSAEVLLWRLPDTPGAELAPADPRPGLRALVAALRPAGPAGSGGGCAVKVHLGAPGRPAAVAADWARTVAAALGGGGGGAPPPGAFATDTLSIATRGLDTPAALREAARAKGYLPGAPGDPGLPFVVGDDPAGAPPVRLAPPDAPDGPGDPSPALELAGAPARAGRLAVLGPVRAHPHLGLAGAIATLGLDLVTSASRLALHRGIRPQVDTPLCAGCGSCLDVCLYDAIVFRGGRATIDHRRCTGCGECMGVCFMAGIGAEDAAGPAAFQAAVARAAVSVAGGLAAAGDASPVYLNMLIQLEAILPAVRGRRLPAPGPGILASRDPVAVDAAAFGLLGERLGGRPSALGGYPQEPDALLATAEALGLGTRAYRLREVGAAPEFLD